MIVATAGHIDHGKTALVKALTGVDTDRLPEEKARGISIDLGFAYWQPAGAPLVGFVDVPGHERFVGNMLAGVCGIDYALLVVAADDGVMPQTREHLQILDLLSVAGGAAVITKTDRVDAARVAQVEREARDLLAPTALAQADVLPVSAVSGAGMERLREVLAAAAAGVRRDAGTGRRLRYAVDRAFTVAGTGTVVTGTVFAGTVAPGDLLTLTPGGQEVRVRGVQMHGRAVGSASAGERCALGLAGVAVGEVQRGDWVVHPALHAPAQRLGVRVRVLDSESGALRHWTPVHVHLGTRELTGRVALRRAAAIEPGQWGLAQLVLDHPIAALAHDRFILRDQSAQRTIAGGLVLDPWTTRQRVRGEAREAQLQALLHADPATRLRELADATPAGVDAAAFARAANLDEAAFGELLRRCELVPLGRDEAQVVLPKGAIDAIAQAVAAALDRCHREQPQAAGMDVAALRRECAPALAPAVFHDLLRALAQRQLVELAGSVARRTGHVASDNPADQRLWHLVLPALREAGLAGMTVPQLAADTRTSEPVLRGLLQRRAQAGELVRVTPDRFYLRATMAAFAAVAAAVAQTAPDGRFGAGAFRDRSGVGRALAVEVLESLDRLGITRRLGDVRVVHRDFVPVLGAAALPTAVQRSKGDARHVR